MKKTLSSKEIEELTKMAESTKKIILEKDLAEKKRAADSFEEHLRNVSFDKLANNFNIFGNYLPYLFNFEYILNRLKEEERKDVSVESLKVKNDLIEQLLKMKKYYAPDTVCHIESVKYFSEIRYFFLRHLFRNKKYKIIFHKKNVKLEDTFYRKGRSKLKIFLLFGTFVFSIILLIINLFALFKVSIYIILFLIGFISFWLILIIGF